MTRSVWPLFAAAGILVAVFMAVDLHPAAEALVLALVAVFIFWSTIAFRELHRRRAVMVGAQSARSKVSQPTR